MRYIDDFDPSLQPLDLLDLVDAPLVADCAVRVLGLAPYQVEFWLLVSGRRRRLFSDMALRVPHMRGIEGHVQGLRMGFHI